ncbi:MAG: hypothetical protein RLZZ216_1455 [Cyanobacteriota bacterium]
MTWLTCDHLNDFASDRLPADLQDQTLLATSNAQPSPQRFTEPTIVQSSSLQQVRPRQQITDRAMISGLVSQSAMGKRIEDPLNSSARGKSRQRQEIHLLIAVDNEQVAHFCLGHSTFLRSCNPAVRDCLPIINPPQSSSRQRSDTINQKPNWQNGSNDFDAVYLPNPKNRFRTCSMNQACLKWRQEAQFAISGQSPMPERWNTSLHEVRGLRRK